MTKGSVFVEMYFVKFMFGASGPGVRSIKNIAQFDIDFSCVGIVKESEPFDQSAVSEGWPLELLQERSDTYYPGSAPILAAHEYRGVALDPFNTVDLTHLVRVPDCKTIL